MNTIITTKTTTTTVTTIADDGTSRTRTWSLTTETNGIFDPAAALAELRNLRGEDAESRSVEECGAIYDKIHGLFEVHPGAREPYEELQESAIVHGTEFNFPGDAVRLIDEQIRITT